MPTRTREIELGPADIVQALRKFGPDDWQELQFEIRASSLLQNANVGRVTELFALLPYDVTEPREKEESLPKEPPPTPAGDRIALEAVERMAGSIPISDPELSRWIAESLDLVYY